MTVNPFVSETVSAPDVRVTIRGPGAAAGSMLSVAVALVAEFTVSEVTVIPAPKFAVEVVGAK